MRRRENLKPLSHARLANASSVSRRGFFPTKVAPAARPALADAHIPMQLPRPRISGGAQEFLPSKATTGKPAALPMDAAAVRFAARRRPLISPRRLARVPLRMPQSPPAHPARSLGNAGGVNAGARRCAFGMARTSARRVELSRQKIRTQGVQLPGALQNTGSGTKGAPARGNALRVSYACGFRLRTPQRAHPPMAAIPASGLRWADKPYTPGAKPPANTPLRVSAPIAIPANRVLCLPAPGPARIGSQLNRRAIDLQKPSPAAGVPPQARWNGEKWDAPADGVVLPGLTLRNWKPGQADALPHIAIRPSPIRGRGQSKHALAPFVPQDVPCGYSFNVGQNGSKDQKR